MEMNNKSSKAIRYLRNTIEEWNCSSSHFRCSNLIDDMKCIELFARKGDWHTKELFKDSKDITLLEVDKNYLEDLKSNFPHAEIYQTDSVDWTSKIKSKKYDIVSIDNPLGCYGKYCENFEIIHNIHNLLANDSVLLVNIVPRPYDTGFGIPLDWDTRRCRFYNVVNSNNLDFKTILKTYTDILNSNGIEVKDYEYICREYANGLDYFYYLCLKLKKK